MANTHRAVIESYAPPAMQVIAAGDREFCETQLAKWVAAHPLEEGESALVLARTTADRTERVGEGERGLVVDLQSDGLLWLINASVFHPRGFALGWSPSAREVMLLGDGTESLSFDESLDKFEAVEALFARARAAHAAKADG